VLFEVHVQPFAPGPFGVPDSMADKRRGDPLALILTGYLGVEEEGVIASVPCHVDKADQAAVWLAGGDPAKAVGTDLVLPSGRRPAAICFDECHHFCVGDWPTPDPAPARLGPAPGMSSEAANPEHGSRTPPRPGLLALTRSSRPGDG
jgi:hypothetical protein